MVIDGHDYPVVSSDYTLQGKGRGKNTAEKVGGGAALGAIIGAIAGGGKGAAIGAGVGAGAGGAVQVLTRGQQVKGPSETLLEFRLQPPDRSARFSGRRERRSERLRPRALPGHAVLRAVDAVAGCRSATTRVFGGEQGRGQTQAQGKVVKHFLLGVLFALLALFIGGFAYLRLGFAEVRGDLPPSRWENALMISAVHASVRRHAPVTPTPVPHPDEKLITAG